MDERKTLQFVEMETKYRVESHLLTEFKRIVEAIPETKSFIYVEGPDVYYTKDDSPGLNFGRYRRPSYGLDGGRSEVTFKYKAEGATNNIMRKEINWRVDVTDEESIVQGFDMLGFKRNFSIWKSCHIYKLDNVTLVFYTVYDTTEGKPSKADNFVEIEVCEDKMEDLVESEAWAILERWERELAPLGITAKNRLKKSLYEMYCRR